MSVQRPELAANAALRDRYRGRRCFILASGPSINELDLRPLRRETCIALSNFFVHQDYAVIKPAFHCVPKFCNPPFTDADAVRWFEEMQTRIGDARLFMDAGDRALVEQHGLFQGRAISYLYTTSAWSDFDRYGIDLTRPVPGVVSVTIMALMIAIYLGFENVYLVGFDHDWMVQYGTSRHFYSTNEKTYGHGYHPSYGAEHWPSYDQGAASIVALWEQYRQLNRYAMQRGVRIVNATPGGCLDVFERVRYAELVRDSASTPVARA